MTFQMHNQQTVLADSLETQLTASLATATNLLSDLVAELTDVS
jgi:hypothetical protein